MDRTDEEGDGTLNKVEFNERFDPLSASHVRPIINEGLAGGFYAGGYGNQEEDPGIPMYDAFSGEQQEFKGLRNFADLSSDEQMGYMMAAGEWRVAQPSGGSNPMAYQAARGVNPNEIRGVGQQDLPQQFDITSLQQRAAAVRQQQGTPEMERIVYDHQRPANQGAPVEIAPDMGGVSQKMADVHNKMFNQGGGKGEYMQQDRQMQQMMQMFMKMMMGGMPPSGQ